MGHVAVCCKLPNGLIIHDPMDYEKKVELKGKNSSKIIGAEYGTTMVDESFWEQWIAVNQDFAPVSSGAIFAADNAGDVDAIAKEFEGRKTGFEGMSQTAHGVKKADDKDVE